MQTESLLLVVGHVVCAMTLIICLAELTSLCVARRRPALKYSIWICALAGVLVSPLVIVGLRQSGLLLTTVSFAPDANESPVDDYTSINPVADQPAESPTRHQLLDAGDSHPPTSTIPAAERIPARRAEPKATAVRPVVWPRGWFRWWHAGVAIWLFGSVFLLVRLIYGALRVRFIVGRGESLAPDSIAAQLRIVRRVLSGNMPVVMTSLRVSSPIVAGVWRPVVLLPEGFSERVGFRQLVEILIHECAHVRRRDCVVNLFQRILVIALWVHPLVHLLNRRLSTCREEICDNFVLRYSEAPDFAETLVRVSQMCRPSGFGMALGVAHYARRLEARVTRLLDDHRDTDTKAAGGWNLSLVIGFAFALLVIGVIRPQRREAIVAGQKDESALDRKFPARRIEWAVPTARQRLAQAGRFVAQLGDGRWKHWSAAQPLAFDEEREALYSVDAGGEFRTWDWETGELRFVGQHSRFRPVLMSVDRRNVYAVRRGFVGCFDLQSGAIQWQMASPGAIRGRLSLSGDGRRLAVGETHSAVIVDTESGRKIRTLAGKAKNDSNRRALWREIALSHDGKRLAVSHGNGDGRLSIWDVDENNQLQSWPAEILRGIPRPVVSLEFSSDGNRLAGCFRTRDAAVWDVATGRIVRRIESKYPVSQIAFRPGRDQLVTVTSSGVENWDLATGSSIWQVEFGRTDLSRWRKPVFNAVGSRLAVGAGHDVLLIDAHRGRETPESLSAAAVTHFVSHPSLPRYAVGTRSGRVSMVDRDGRVRKSWQAHSARIWSLAFDATGSSIATVGADLKVRSWDCGSGRKLHEMPLERTLQYTLAYRADGLLAVGSRSTRAALVDIKTKQVRGRTPERSSGRLAFVGKSSELFYAGREHLIEGWDTQTNMPTRAFGPAGRGIEVPLSVSPQNTHVAAGRHTSSIGIWRLKDGQAISLTLPPATRLASKRQRMRLRALAFSRDGKQIVCGAQDGRIQTWSLETGQRTDQLQLGPRHGVIQGIATVPDRETLVTVGGNGVVYFIKPNLSTTRAGP